MSGLQLLPDALLSPTHSVARQFLARGILSYREAAAYVHQLPYGRTSVATAFETVLTEGRGTCSSKHALLAALAQEHDLEVQLILGLFDMAEANTPGLGATLHRYGLTSIPEAHCYLRSGGERIDLTHPGSSGFCVLEMRQAEQIAPEQAGAYKQTWHLQRLVHWCTERDLDPQLVWQARQDCIRALSRRPAA